MPAKNVETVRRHYAAYNRQDLTATLAGLHEEIEIDLSATVMPETILRGHAQVAAVFTEQWQTSGVVEQRPSECIELDDQRVLVALECWARPDSPSGAELLMQLADVWTMRDGRAVRIEVHPSKESALAALTPDRAQASGTG